MDTSATNIKKICFVGTGAFGYALALCFARANTTIEIALNDVDKETVESLSAVGKHPRFHTQHTLPSNCWASLDVKECLKGADLVVAAVPAQFLTKALAPLGNDLPKDAILLNIAKALEDKTDKRMSEVIRDALPKGATNPIATLSGGMLAGDVADGSPVGCDIGCTDERALLELKYLFKPTNIYVATLTDIKSVEFGGAFKNVVAIGAGLVDGLKLGTSSKAFLVIQCLGEIENLAIAMGAQYKSLHTQSYSWMGDLMTTAFGDSRNRLFGEYIGSGMATEQALQTLHDQHKHAEGYVTLKVVQDLFTTHQVESHMVRTIYEIVYEGKNAQVLRNMAVHMKANL